MAGTLFAATAAFLILESVALLGTDTGLVRWLPAQLASGRAADLPRTLVVSAVPVLALSLGVAVTLYAAAPALAPAPGRRGRRPHDDGHAAGARPGPPRGRALRPGAGGDPRHGVHASDGARGEHRPPRLQAVAVLVVYLTGGGALALALAWSLPYVVGLALAGVWLRRRFAARITPDRRRPRRGARWRVSSGPTPRPVRSRG